jgi:hypothetical protein
MASPTPGPWSVPHFATAKDENDCTCTYVLADTMFGAVCSVHIDNGKRVGDGGNDCPSPEEAKANAHLISAAPDLLSALQAIMADAPSKWVMDAEMYEAARVAIAKALGQ